jgi:hypothetical protein
MARYVAKNTVVYTSKDSIAPGEVFDPAEKGISTADIKALLASGDISAAHELQEEPGNAPGKKPNVAETLLLIAAAQTVEDLDKLAEGEARVTVLPAIAARRAELAPPE